MTLPLRLSEMRPRAALCLALSSLLPACATVPVQQGKSLSSYAEMAPSDGILTRAKLRVDSSPVLAARTVRIVPTSAQISNGDFEARDLALVTNTIDRDLCTGLSDRFEVVGPNQPADLVIRATVTNVVATDQALAATSTIASLGARVALPVPVPRLPLGLGGLSVEAEAVGKDGSQKAAMLWARGADMITTRARVSAVGDAYSLSSAFAADFSRMLVKGEDPFKGLPALPSLQSIGASLGGDPKYDACKAFGRAPGVMGLVAGQIGLPPGWTDNGAAAVAEQKTDFNGPQ